MERLKFHLLVKEVILFAKASKKFSLKKPIISKLFPFYDFKALFYFPLTYDKLPGYNNNELIIIPLQRN